jgi:hypothetical protein
VCAQRGELSDDNEPAGHQDDIDRSEGGHRQSELLANEHDPRLRDIADPHEE